MILYDSLGFPIRNLDPVGGDTIADARPVTQNISALNAEIIIDCAGEHTASVVVNGTFVQTLIAQISFDGTNFIQVPLWNLSTESFVTNITAAASLQFDIPAGSKRIKIFNTVFTSGTAVVAFRASKAMDFVYAKDIPANLSATVTGLSGAVATLTIPGSVGLYNYLVALYVTKFAAAALTAAATPVLVPITGVTGSPILSFSASGDALGTVEKQQFEPNKPLKGSAVNTAMVVSCPVTAGVIWRVNAVYYVGA